MHHKNHLALPAGKKASQKHDMLSCPGERYDSIIIGEGLEHRRVSWVLNQTPQLGNDTTSGQSAAVPLIQPAAYLHRRMENFEGREQREFVMHGCQHGFYKVIVPPAGETGEK